MRLRNILAAAVAAFLCATALAAPASPVPFTYVQPDGSVIRLQLHGDEHFHWTTLYPTDQVVALDEDGWWRPSVIDEASRKAGQARRQAANASRLLRAPHRSPAEDPLNRGERRIPVLLLEFPDVKFSIEDPRPKFDALMNQPGYDANGATGSVRDYYVENSRGAFKPIFDVYGPVELPQSCFQFYGGGAARADDAALDGMALLDDQIDFSRYDYDGDGAVDAVLYFFAGYAANEGADVNTHIWPCTADLRSGFGSNRTFDGKHPGYFSCMAELSGSSGTTMCGIGTTCHEFAHTLGLPDFYPSGTADKVNGELYEFALMCSGNYLNNFRTPPYLTALERTMLGWMSEADIREFPAGPVSFGSISDGVAYKSFTETEDEYFLYECHDGRGWDAYLPKGMVVYHVDRSNTLLSKGRTALDYWDIQNVNNAPGHPCFYVVPAGHQAADFYAEPDRTKFVFPGSLSIDTFSPVDWQGRSTGLSLSDIRFSDAEGKVSLMVSYDRDRIIRGTVTGPTGRGIEGVLAVVEGTYTAVSDKDGCFNIDMDGHQGATVHVTVSKEGYLTTGADITLKDHTTYFRIALQKVDETALREFRYYDPGLNSHQCGNGVSISQMAAIRIPASELEENGGTVMSVSFNPYFGAEAYYIIVDDGDERILTWKLPDSMDRQMQTFDLSTLQADFSGKKDLYVGIAIDRCGTYSQPERPFEGVQGTGHFYLSPFDLTHSDWEQLPGWDLVLTASLVGRTAPRPENPVSTFADMGVNAIADPGDGVYAAGAAFQLKLELADGSIPQSVSWSFDGVPVSASTTLTLPVGPHTVTALLTYADGTAETLELTLDVK